MTAVTSYHHHRAVQVTHDFISYVCTGTDCMYTVVGVRYGTHACTDHCAHSVVHHHDLYMNSATWVQPHVLPEIEGCTGLLAMWGVARGWLGVGEGVIYST